jgi:hypothetical protein
MIARGCGFLVLAACSRRVCACVLAQLQGTAPMSPSILGSTCVKRAARVIRQHEIVTATYLSTSSAELAAHGACRILLRLLLLCVDQTKHAQQGSNQKRASRSRNVGQVPF